MSTPALMAPHDMSRGKGRIELILGPMFSGKTTELIRRITRFGFANFKCLVIKYAGDVRYSSTDVATHDAVCLPAVSCSTLKESKAKALEYDVIGIDEGQFFPDVVQFCEEMANRGKVILVAALDGTFQRQGFGDFLQLVPLAESVVKLHAVCMRCYSMGCFTKRMSNEQAVEIIGGTDKYMSVCRECYHSGSPVKPRITGPPNVLQENSPHKCSPLKSPLKKVSPLKRSPLKSLQETSPQELSEVSFLPKRLYV